MQTLEFQPAFRARLNGPVVVTGAGGWLGQAALEMFAAALPLERIHAFGASARIHRLRNGAALPIQPLAALGELRVKNAIVFHLAFLTREHAGRMPLEDYVSANRGISAQVTGFIRRNGAAGVFLPSSGAVYAPKPNPYGDCKLEDERNFEALGCPAAIIRVFNLAGPFINKLDSYALACIVGDVLAGRPVTLRAAHPVWRAYAHVGDVVNIALGLILRGEMVPVFDTSGEAVELSTLARRVARVLGRGEPNICRPEWEGGTPDRYLGDMAAYAAHAAALGIRLHSLDEQILDTADYLV